MNKEGAISMIFQTESEKIDMFCDPSFVNFDPVLQMEVSLDPGGDPYSQDPSQRPGPSNPSPDVVCFSALHVSDACNICADNSEPCSGNCECGCISLSPCEDSAAELFKIYSHQTSNSWAGLRNGGLAPSQIVPGAEIPDTKGLGLRPFKDYEDSTITELAGTFRDNAHGLPIGRTVRFNGVVVLILTCRQKFLN